MADFNSQYQQLIVANGIDDAIIAASNTIKVFEPLQTFMTRRSRVLLQFAQFLNNFNLQLSIQFSHKL